MPDSEPKPDNLPQRLCNEIQLFDLCDLNSCKHRSDRFCTDPDLLGRFEKIAENELQTPERYISDEVDAEANDGDDYGDGDGFDDGYDEFTMDNFEGGEEDGCEDEE